MIECHPLLKPVVALAKPVVHAVRNWQPHHRVVGVRHIARHTAHKIHRVAAAVTPPPGVMTVCQRVAGPLLAGGLVLLPPASAVPPVGGIGGFPGAIIPEYGAPAFASGFIGPGGFVGPAGFGGYGPGGIAGGFIAPGNGVGPASVPTLIASNDTPGTPTDTPILTTRTPGASTPQTQGDTPTGQTPGGPTGGDTPGTGAPPGASTPETPVNTPEPGTIALLGGLLVVAVFARIRLRSPR